MSTPADYRTEIADAANRYVRTPGGAPPPPLLEAILFAESRGDPRMVRGTARGVAGIAPESDAWKWYLASPLARTYGTDPVQTLHQPQAGIEILALELNKRQEQGIAAQEAGRPDALTDWYMASLAHRGYADNRGITDRGKGRDALGYFLNQKQYLSGMFGAQEYARIDAAEQGQVIVNQSGDGLQYVSDDPAKTPVGNVIDVGKDMGTVGRDSAGKVINAGKTTVGAAVSGVGDAVSRLVAGAGQLVIRSGIYLVGILLALVGLYLVFRQEGGM